MQEEDRLDFLSRIASMYYEQGMTQRHISAELGYSRSAISRFLTEAREAGIVEIRIHHPRERSSELERDLTEAFGLKQVRVFVRRSLTYAQTMQRLGSIGARLLEQVIRDESIVGVGWGSGVYEVIDALRPRQRPDIRVIQLAGTVGLADPRLDGPELARRLSGLFGGRYQTLATPLVVDDPATRDALIRDSHIRDALTLARDVEVALVNLNSLDARKSSLTDAGYLTRSEYSEITEAGAVGSVCAVHYDHNGQMLDSPLTHRLIGVTAETLQSIPLTLSVVGGQDKAQAVLGAIRGGLINCLVTDDETARTLVDHA